MKKIPIFLAFLAVGAGGVFCVFGLATPARADEALTSTITLPANSGTYSSPVSFSATGSGTNFSSLVSNLDSSLVSWWKMDDGTNNKTITDYMGNNNGTSQQNTTALQTTGKNGGALMFNGTSDYASIPDNASLKPAAITVSAWIKTSDVTQNYAMFASKSSNGGDGWNLRFNSVSGKPMFIALVGDTFVDQSLYSVSIAAANDQWTHVVGVYDGNAVKTYVNGDLSGSYSISGNLVFNTDDLLLGRRADGFYFNGSIDDVQIYNRALSADEITALYNGTAISHTAALSNGSHTYQVFAEDTAGNVASAGPNTFTVATPTPTLTDPTPTTLPVSPTPTPIVISTPHSSGSIQSQVSYLQSVGQTAEANKLKAEWPNLFNEFPLSTTGPVVLPAIHKFIFTRNLFLGMTGADVKALQQYLNSNGFLVTQKGAGSPGHETTYFGAATRQGLLRFQKAVQIPGATGLLGSVTRKYINSH